MSVQLDELRALVAKWRTRGEEDISRSGRLENPWVLECADELEAALAHGPVAPGDTRTEQLAALVALVARMRKSVKPLEGLGESNRILAGHVNMWADELEALAVPSGPAPVTNYEHLYNRVMSLLHNTKIKHGLCQPRERKACTHCNAIEELEKMLAEYKGARIVACAPTLSVEQPAQPNSEALREALNRIARWLDGDAAIIGADSYTTLSGRLSEYAVELRAIAKAPASTSPAAEDAKESGK